MKANHILIFGIVLSIVALLIPSPTTDLNWPLFILVASFILVCKSIFALFNGKRIIYYLIYIPIIFLYYSFTHYLGDRYHLINYKGHFKVIASAYRIGASNRGYSVGYDYDEGGRLRSSDQYVDEFYYKQIKDLKIVIIERDMASEIVNWYPTPQEILKYSYPVYYRNDEEIGNDSYEYAISEHDIAYKNFGFNIVQFATSVDNNTIVVTKLNGEKCYIPKKNNTTDTFLVYSNINPEFYDGWHVHSHSTKNIAKIKESGYGYLFRGKIYSAAETEKYWNIIEQYKLRNH